ncbi:hypothetical protein [Pseudohongiella sp.]|uniref:hypothetical protein n=1 Tax=Pseudohongiella sp. TaxID=1979412 RepID=UPI00182F2AAE|nr:hypothetical protein [Pseudohongiella sp.]HDZ09969.1 hypothetical protein [Pseudohongiella sp.]HEA64396.1 hypothetical protein [Pseudohongiella sp.]
MSSVLDGVVGAVVTATVSEPEILFLSEEPDFYIIWCLGARFFLIIAIRVFGLCAGSQIGSRFAQCDARATPDD